jgi:hypothetical protein
VHRVAAKRFTRWQDWMIVTVGRTDCIQQH